jgi:hemoglobin-like flavoprotein
MVTMNEYMGINSSGYPTIQTRLFYCIKQVNSSNNTPAVKEFWRVQAAELAAKIINTK